MVSAFDRAATEGIVEVGAAVGAQAFALWAADYLHGQAEEDMLTESVAEREAISFIERDFDFAFLEVDLGVVRGVLDGAVEEVEVVVYGNGRGFEAAVAGGAELDFNVAADADFPESIAEEFRLTGGVEAAVLRDFLREPDLAWSVGDIEEDWMVFEFGKRKVHGRLLESNDTTKPREPVPRVTVTSL
jgi:hypothetical protein